MFDIQSSLNQISLSHFLIVIIIVLSIYYITIKDNSETFPAQNPMNISSITRGITRQTLNAIAQGASQLNRTTHQTNTSKYILNNNESLLVGEHLQFPDGTSILVHQQDGNVVLYNKGNAVWSTNTSGKETRNLIMQMDGNLVLYDNNNNAIWASGTSGPNAQLILQNDNNLVIYSNGNALWASGTSQ